jgi:hypothetical protein
MSCCLGRQGRPWQGRQYGPWRCLVNPLSREYYRGKYHWMVDLLLDWFGMSCMATDSFCFYLQNRLIQTSQTGGQQYSDTSPFSIPCLVHNSEVIVIEIEADTIQWSLWSDCPEIRDFENALKDYFFHLDDLTFARGGFKIMFLACSDAIVRFTVDW